MKKVSIAIAIVLGLMGCSSTTQSQSHIETPLGKIGFENGYPAEESVPMLFDELDYQRATQAYLWGIPAYPSCLCVRAGRGI